MSDLCGWDDGSRRIGSLLEMMQFYAELFIKAVWEIHQIEGQWKHGRLDENIPFPRALLAKTGILQIDCVVHGLTSTAQKCSRIMERCDGSQPITYREGVALMNELRERLEDDLHSRVFLNLTPNEAEIYQKPFDDGWSGITNRFKAATGDVEEMRKCFALGRYPASVFHSMQVIEHSLIELGACLGVKDHKPGWNATTRELARIVSTSHDKRTDWERKHFLFIEQMNAVTQSLMTAWRHKIDHAAGRLTLLSGDFNADIAADIISATRAFMRRLSTELPTDKKP
jgi:hypothetical protein